MEGSLSKWTNVMNGWQYRYFVLDYHAGLFSYYTSREKMMGGSRRGCVRLTGALVRIDDEDDATFTIVVDGKSFCFQARDHEEREKWMQALDDTVLQHNQMRKIGGPSTSIRINWSSGGTEPPTIQDLNKNLTEAGSFTAEQIENYDISTEHLASAGLSCEKSNGNREYDIQMGDKLSEAIATRNLVMKSEQDSPVSVTCPEYKDKGKASPKLAQQSIPDESYESDSDDEFYEANDVVKELDGQNFPINSSLEESVGLARPESLEFHETSSRVSNGQGTIVSPMTPGLDGNDESIDYDKLYNNLDDEEDIDMKSQGSVITHLLSQLHFGMDLTKIVMPTFILERRSLLEVYSDFFAHPDLFLEIPDGNSPEERMIRALKWYLSSFHAGRKSSIAKKPYNPILGETFSCHWKVRPEKSHSPQAENGSNLGAEKNCFPKEFAKESALPECGPDDLTFIAEQVSHHPPTSAFYAEHVNKKISTCVHITNKSSFLGMSIGVHNVGDGKITLLDHKEEYVATFPSIYARSILTVPWKELGGKCEIQCSKTGYSASIEFKCKPFLGSDINKVSAKVFAPDVKKPILKVDGEWKGKMMAKWANGKNDVFIDVNQHPIIHPKLCKPVAQQIRTESRRLWKDVTYNLKEDNIEAATSAKFALEQQQRNDVAKRKEDGTKWEASFFTREGEGSSSDGWHYNTPLKDSLNQKD